MYGGTPSAGRGATHPIYEAKIAMQAATVSRRPPYRPPGLIAGPPQGWPLVTVLDYWREVISKAVIATSVSPGAMAAISLGRSLVASSMTLRSIACDSGGHEIIRSESHIRTRPSADSCLSLQLSGKGPLTQRDRSIVLSPGTMGLVDAGQPFSVVLRREVLGW